MRVSPPYLKQLIWHRSHLSCTQREVGGRYLIDRVVDFCALSAKSNKVIQSKSAETKNCCITTAEKFCWCWCNSFQFTQNKFFNESLKMCNLSWLNSAFIKRQELGYIWAHMNHPWGLKGGGWVSQAEVACIFLIHSGISQTWHNLTVSTICTDVSS